MKLAILDIGGSSIKYALMNECQEFLKRGKQETPLDDMSQLWGYWMQFGKKLVETLKD